MIKRVDIIDFLRGLVVILMLLDHVRDLFHVHSIDQSPTDLAVSPPSVFYTRLITHICAPIFVFLAGSSAYLLRTKIQEAKPFRNHLFRRGAWLIILDFTLVNFGLFFDIKFGLVLVDVLSAIGFSMIILGLVNRFSTRQVFWLALLIFALCQGAFVSQLALLKPLSFLYSPNAFPLANGTLLVVGYPPVAWLGFCLLGYALGDYFLGKAPIKFWQMGLICWALFLLIRYLQIGGDSPWKLEADDHLTLMSFLNVSKYPPSLSFACLTLGTLFFLASVFPLVKKNWVEFISAYGRVPLFFFISHWFVLHLILFVLIFRQGFTWADVEFGFQLTRPKTFVGLSTAQVYVLWMLVAALYYPLCRFYFGRQQGKK
ncbi:DUF1624 domain-containing protein [Aquirufa rosea]|uniref:DUF1624 domain-containing protein n=1 Tax=Aquirufa rosea TaxID=2509241 RepID=A0A4Q1BZ46_9BACT|nr:heparan-alpha-glucosaminide N-acetyltransferase domain-containing protein [Aquirufa rosea]RXK48797.1 DUF1624 domain-containing protein [Aquirufa rosea]